MTKFYFDTGVRPYSHTPPVKLMPYAELSPNGVMVIPFWCEDVPPGFTFHHASDRPESIRPGQIMREIHNSGLISKYAFFGPPGQNNSRNSTGNKNESR